MRVKVTKETITRNTSDICYRCALSPRTCGFNPALCRLFDEGDAAYHAQVDEDAIRREDDGRETERPDRADDI